MEGMPLTDRISLEIAKFSFGFTRKEYYDDLAEALQDGGDPLSKVKTDATRARERHDVMAALYELWMHRMEEASFVSAIADTVPPLDRMILQSSDSANGLIKGLKFLGLAIEASSKMRFAIIKALAMPSVLVLVFAAMLAAFAYQIVPSLTAMLPADKWPILGKIVYGLSMFISKHGHWVLAALIAATIFMVMTFSRWTGRVRIWFDTYVPPYMIYRDYMGHLFLVSLGALLEKDVGLTEALSTLQANSNRWVAWHIGMIKEGLLFDAQNPGKAFDTGMFSQRLADRILDFSTRSANSQATSFPEAIAKVGLKAVDKSVALVTASARILNGLLLVLCGAFLLFMFSGIAMTVQTVRTEQMSKLHSR